MRKTTFATLAAAAVALTSGACGGSTDIDRFRIPAENMSPTLDVGARAEFDMNAYDDAAPELGDVVVVHPPRTAMGEAGPLCAAPRTPSESELCERAVPERADDRFVMRVVALDGSRVRFGDGIATVDGVRERRREVRRCTTSGCTFTNEITVPADHVYVAGDNRGASSDSRFWGAVPEAWVVGRYVRTVGR